jgi:hypothetical protein
LFCQKTVDVECSVHEFMYILGLIEMHTSWLVSKSRLFTVLHTLYLNNNSFFHSSRFDETDSD